MADVLALLGQLEDEETKAKATTKSSKKGKHSNPKDIAAQNASKNAGKKPRKPPALSRQSSIASSVGKTYAPISPGQSLRPPKSNTDARSERSASVGAESRRISFADPPRPGANKIYIPTKTDSLASGFPYDPRLNKYRVPEEEWRDFTDELMAAAAVPGPIWTWTFRKKEVIKRIRRELQYEGNVGRVFKKWNKLFKRQRFQAWLELPGAKIEDVGNGEKVNLKRFNVVITPNSEQRPLSVYSRNSSMTRSITGEGVTAAMARTEANSEMTDDE